jgi:hypothetical protein
VFVREVAFSYRFEGLLFFSASLRRTSEELEVALEVKANTYGVSIVGDAGQVVGRDPVPSPTRMPLRSSGN